MNHRQNVPPGCHPNDTGPGGEDTYECACCGGAFVQSELDSDGDEPTCKACALWERERVREEDAEVQAALKMAAGVQLYEALQAASLALRELACHPAFADDAPEFNEGGIGYEARVQAIKALNLATQGGAQ